MSESEYGKRNIMPKWLVMMLIIVISAAILAGIAGMIIKELNNPKPIKTYEKGFEFEDHGQIIKADGTNLLPPGSIKNIIELNDKVTKIPGTSYVQDNDEITIISISSKKEDLEKVSAQVGDFIVSFRVIEGQDIKIYMDLRGISPQAERVPLSIALFSNERPAPDSFIKGSSLFIENALKEKNTVFVYKKEDWDKSKTIYLRVSVYKKSVNNT